jgi:rod shape-determining protein MreD
VQTFKIALTLILALILQMLLPKHFRMFQYVEFPLLVTVYLSLMRAPLLGMTAGVVSGIGGDIISGSDIIGVSGFSKTLIGYVVAKASVNFPLENPLTRLGIVTLASIANTILVIGLYLMLEQPIQNVSAWGDFLKALGLNTLGDTLASIVLFMVLNKVFPEVGETKRMAIKKRHYG